jgi:probable F420-dependent oxidoreductase
VRFGITFANTMSWGNPAGAVEAARAADENGFESIWTVEHVVYPDDYQSTYPYSADGRMPAVRSTPIPDPLIWLAYIASVTSRIRLATGILILPERNPVVLAKELATLDHLSGGRVELGIGVGWLREEFDALGIPWERRGARTDEYIEAMRALWASDGASFDGEFASFSGVSSNPKPPNGAVRIVVGGHTRAAAERAGRLGDGLFPAHGSPKELADLLDIARQTAAASGRDPGALELTTGAPGNLSQDPAAVVEELASVGVSRIVVPAFTLMKPNATEAIGAFAERVLTPTSSALS